MHRLHLVERAPLPDALKRELRLGLRALEEVAAVGGDERDAARVGELGEHAVERAVLREAVVLELDEEVVAVEVVQAPERLGAGLGPLHEHLLRHVPAEAGGERDDALAVRVEELEVDARGPGDHALDPAEADELDDVLVADVGLRQEHDVAADGRLLVPAMAVDEGQLGPEDGLHVGALTRFVELDGAVHVGAVGQGDRGHVHLLACFHQLADADRAIEHRELGVHVQMNEALVRSLLRGHRARLTRIRHQSTRPRTILGLHSTFSLRRNTPVFLAPRKCTVKSKPCTIITPRGDSCGSRSARQGKARMSGVGVARVLRSC